MSISVPGSAGSRRSGYFQNSKQPSSNITPSNTARNRAFNSGNQEGSTWSSFVTGKASTSKRPLSCSTSAPGSSRKRTLAYSSSSVPSKASSPSSCTDKEETDESICEEDITSHRENIAFDESDEETNIKTIMCTVWSGSKLGVAYYDTFSSKLHLMMDIVETSDFQFLKRVQEQINPDIIVTSSKQEERFIAVLQGKEGENNDEQLCQQTDVEVLPAIDFTVDACKRRIIALNGLPGMPQHFTDMERTIYMTSLVPFDNVNMVRAAGALLKYLEKKRFGQELEDPDVHVPILDLVVFSIDDMVIVDDNTYSALQIFQKESHPSVYKSGTSSKEGLSLFGVLNRTRSALGSRLLRMWFLRPTRDILVLTERQKAITFFTTPRNIDLIASLQDCLKNVKNVSRILVRMKTAQASITDWQALYKTVYNAMYIADLCRTIPSEIAIAKKITVLVTQDLHNIASLINTIIDFDDSTEQNRFVVKPGVDPALDERKRTYNGLPDFMTKVARKELNKLNPSIVECNVIYLPQLGYLLAVPRTTEMKEEKDFEMDGLDFVFLSNNMVYYKSASTRELDSLLGDTQCEITDHETAIMHRLQSTILERTKVLLDVMECTAELDCLISLAVSARENNYVCPEITTKSILHITGGMHPLQELCVSQFVPNDTAINEDSGRVVILTGPNASGKSVYLKQVGLIVFLAHIGSFVPAESAIIGVTDRLFTRIHTRETVSVGLSTFMIDLNQVASAIQSATDKSLVLIDEFGKGTATVDGLSLLCATLRHWLASSSKCPKTLVSTHFHSLIRQKLLPDIPILRFQTTEVIQDGKELVFLYHLVDGHAKTSYASHIAALAGMPEHLVKRGTEVSELVRCNEPVQRIDSISSETQQKRFAAIVNGFLSLDLERDNLHGFLADFVTPVSEER
ncbi:mutS protein homolog 5 isoform X2 [Nematostella vectensis]|uniref:mutS protein homolog 5 isoform X2 n=1 Tax=Nematostella vectensis TaxID=45351 RepID=UPI0020776AFA|nr:mutS protein homolog 5 isoform X2 [Nematostella vectensis]